MVMIKQRLFGRLCNERIDLRRDIETNIHDVVLWLRHFKLSDDELWQNLCFYEPRIEQLSIEERERFIRLMRS